MTHENRGAAFDFTGLLAGQGEVAPPAPGAAAPGAAAARPDLDRLARAAAAALRVPAALVALVGDDGELAIAGAAGPREVPGAAALCRRVVASGRPLDLGEGREVAAFLGMPLAGAGGRVLGAICAIDRVPRTWADWEAATLGELAAAAVDALAARRERDDARRAAQAEAGEWRLREMADVVPQLVWTIRPDGRPVAFNRRWHEYTGLSPERCRAEGWAHLIHPDHRAAIVGRWAEALATGESFEAEFRLRRAADGVYRWFLGRGLPVRDDAGRVVKWLGTCTDIDDHKRLEETLQEQARQREAAIRELQWNQALLAAERVVLELIARGANLDATLEEVVRLLERLSDGVVGSILLLDRDGARLRHGAAPSLPEAYQRGIEGAADGPAAAFGAVAIGRGPAGPVDIAADPSWAALRAHALGFGLRASWSAPIVAEGGAVLGAFVAYAGAPRSPGPRDWGLLGIAVQLAGIALERKRADGERARLLEREQAARAEAEKANRAKDQFLAVLSHELRTPLTPVLMSASALLDDPALTAELRATMEMIRRSVELEARLIDDLLDVTRISRGKLALAREPTDAHALVRQTAEICRGEVHAGKVRLELDLAAGHAVVDADPARLHQVLWNLVKNAVKFTPAGGTVAVRTSNPDGPGGLAIEVADTGIGIPAEALGRIFNAFEQADNTTTRRFGGLGLGLAISRSVVQAHGGTLVARSDGPGLGSTFRVELATIPAPAPAPAPASPPAGPPPPDPRAAGPAARPLSILLVEDDRDTLKVMARVLRRRGHRVETAADVRTGAELGAAGRFDLLISDLGLPDGSGHDLMRRLRACRPIPGIALTGFGMDEDARRSREAGFAAHLTKPIDFPKLEGMIYQVAARSGAGPAA